jgi:PAS domain S-box-containing protein
MESLRESNRRAKLMTENATCMVLAYDMERNLLFANPAVGKLTGYSASDLQRHGFTRWVHPDDRRRMVDHWERLFREGAYLEEEYRLVAQNGRVRWVKATWGRILDDAGQQTGVQGCEQEITNCKYNEQALAGIRKALPKASEQRAACGGNGQFKGYVSFCNECRRQGGLLEVVCPGPDGLDARRDDRPSSASILRCGISGTVNCGDPDGAGNRTAANPLREPHPDSRRGAAMAAMEWHRLARRRRRHGRIRQLGPT